MPVKIGVVIDKPLRDRLFMPADQSRLNTLGDVVWTEKTEPLTESEAVELLRECEIGIGSWRSPYPTEALIAACPHLKLWEHAAGSVKRMFGPHLTGRDLVIACCKPALADIVAEMTLGEIFLGLRRVFENATLNRTTICGHPKNIKVIFGSTIGIVGASLIGRRMIHLLKTFGCHILLFDPYVTDAEATNLGVEKLTDLPTLCARCDVISLHTPDLPETRHIMGAKEFQAMQDESIFINTSRGNCVDESALVAELEKGRLFAFLDVSAPEPTPLESPLRSLPNVVYTSHIAGPPCYNIGHQAVNDVEAFLKGDSPLHVVTEEMLPTTA